MINLYWWRLHPLNRRGTPVETLNREAGHRDPNQITHTRSDILRARIFAIAPARRGVIRMAMIWTICVRTRHSSWPAVACRRAVMTWPHNRPCHAGRTPPTCAP